mgnify:CR=1 FL=1
MTDVLILEDELTSLQALSEILTTYSDDIRVHKASSLKEAKDLLDQEIRYGLFPFGCKSKRRGPGAVSYTHLRAHET